MNSMNDFKVGDIVYHSISNSSWAPRCKKIVVTKMVHIGEVVKVRELTCDVLFKAGTKPKHCQKISLKLKERKWN